MLKKLNIAMTYPVNWSNYAVMRDYIQNFFDATGPSQFQDAFRYQYENQVLVMFAKKGFAGIVAGTAMSVAIRFACHLLSGVYVFASAGKLWEGFETSNTWLYSFVYNGCYMLPELVMTIIGAAIVYKALVNRNI